MFDSASIFLQTCLQIPNEWSLDVPASMNLMCPPWYFEMYQNRARRCQQQQQQQQQQEQAALLASSSRSTANSSDDRARPPQQSGNGYDHEEMGMTSERQRVIQASLFKMLGQAEDDEPESASEEKKKEANESSSSSLPH